MNLEAWNTYLRKIFNMEYDKKFSEVFELH